MNQVQKVQRRIVFVKAVIPAASELVIRQAPLRNAIQQQLLSPLATDVASTAAGAPTPTPAGLQTPTASLPRDGPALSNDAFDRPVASAPKRMISAR